jgi:hypothetical protein
MEGTTQESRSYTNNFMLPQGDVGVNLGGTMTANSTTPTIQDYEAIFGPAARQIKEDTQRHKRHQRWHLPDVLRGSNTFLADRVDGLITDATNSPFTRNILPYVYLENPDQKLKWNVWRFDEGLATRVPYESAARVLTQSKTSQAAYITRNGMAIQMEHNFMMSPAGRENFKRQLMQLVGSIQMSNDLDVHHALLLAPNYENHLREKYYTTEKTTLQLIRQYVDSYGMMQKHPNALDIMIEDAKNTLKTWGSPPPTFLMCNGALTMQMTFNPEKTQYLTNGTGGPMLLKQGPDLPSYRGLNIIHSRKFSMNTGEPPRDILRRRSRVAEHYRINGTVRELKDNRWRFYDQSKDGTFDLTFRELLEHSWIDSAIAGNVTKQAQPRPSVVRPARRPYDNPDFKLLSAPLQLTSPNLTAGDIGVHYPDQVANEMEGYRRLRAEGNPYHAHDLNALRVRESMDGALAVSAGLAGIAPSHAMAVDNVSTMLAGNSGVLHWAAHQFRSLRASLKAPEGKQDVLAREAVLLKAKRLTLKGDSLHIGYQTIPKDEITEAQAEFKKRPWTATEMSAAVGVVGSVLFNGIRAPNALNPQVPESAARQFVPFIQSCFCRSMMDSSLCNALLAHVNVPLDLQGEFLSFLGLADLGNREELAASQADRDSPYCSVLMVKYISHAHPNDTVRERCGKVLESLAPEVSRQLDDTLLDYSNKVIDSLDSGSQTSMDVRFLTSLLQRSTSERLQAPTQSRLHTLATSTMHVNASGDTISSSPIFSRERDDETRALLASNGLKLESDALLGTEFRCYPFPLTSADLSSVDSILQHSRLEEYQSPSLNLEALRTDIQGFFEAQDSRDHLLSHLYRLAFARMFTSVMHYANDAAAPGCVLAAKSAVGNVRHTLGARITSSPLVVDVPSIGLNFDNENNALTFDDIYNAIVSDTETAATQTVINELNRRSPEYQPPAAAVYRPPPRAPGPPGPGAGVNPNPLLDWYVDIVCVRPNIEHNMLAAIMGRGGTGELGATYWGQTEMTCYDDGQHGIWGMQYKYHAKALVHNERNLIRLWDICFDGYNGGMDDTVLDWRDGGDLDQFRKDTSSIDKPYEGKSMFIMSFFVPPGHDNITKIKQPWPNPIVFYDPHSANTNENLPIDPDNLYNTVKPEMRVFTKDWYRDKYLHYLALLPNFNQLHALRKVAGQQTVQNETNVCALSFHGDVTMCSAGGPEISKVHGSGHLGHSFQGVASVREGKGLRPMMQPSLTRLI